MLVSRLQPPSPSSGKEDEIWGELRKGGGIQLTLGQVCWGPRTKARGAVSVLQTCSVPEHYSLGTFAQGVVWPLKPSKISAEQNSVFPGHPAPHPIIPRFPDNTVHLRIPDQTQEDLEFKAAHPLLGVCMPCKSLRKNMAEDTIGSSKVPKEEA